MKEKNKHKNTKKNNKKKRKSHQTSHGKSTKKVRYAVAGLGYISQIAVLPAFKHSKNSELVALISSDEEKLQKLGKKYKVPHLYLADQYEECVQRGEVDAVYIALPNSAHRAYTLAAASAGVHVLCEKPMALTPSDCREMMDACQENDVRLMIAYRLHFDKANLSAMETAQSGTLGELRLFSSVFSFNIVDPKNIRLRSALGGGPLYDLGIYCINAARYIFRSEPIEVSAFEIKGDSEKFKEVEEAVCATLVFPEERLAQFICSFGASDTSMFDVIGTKGCLRVEPAYDFGNALEHQLQIGEKTKKKKFPKTDQFAPELTYFSDCILSNKKPEPSGLEGLIDVEIITAIYRSVDERRAIRIDEIRKPQRPNLKLLREVPPIKEPELINATRPSSR